MAEISNAYDKFSIYGKSDTIIAKARNRRSGD